MAATACVYNLTKGDRGQKIHPHILREVVHCTLTAMENFPNHLQVRINLTIQIENVVMNNRISFVSSCRKTHY